MAHDKKGQGGIVLSVLKNRLFDFSVDHDEGLPTMNAGYTIVMGTSLRMNKSFYKRNSSDRQVNTKFRTASKGV